MLRLKPAGIGEEFMIFRCHYFPTVIVANYDKSR